MGESHRELEQLPASSAAGTSRDRPALPRFIRDGRWERTGGAQTILDTHLPPSFIPPLTKTFSPSCKAFSACTPTASRLRLWDLSTLSIQPLLLL
mmetsp:Transcript_16288/g.32765  ORF Transcript_16288/g.32765 Transcript_16288/m.32765 type:complete len:95 (-) Transcript_16288:524-808(-)